MKILTKTLNNIIFQNVGDIYEHNGTIYHKKYDRQITSFMVQRLGKEVELVIDSRDEFGCIWQPWMIERILDK